MSHRRHRPTAFEVSFRGETDRPASAVSSRSSSVASSSSKRKYDSDAQAPRARPLPPVAYYDPSNIPRGIEVHKETKEFFLPGEDPDDDYDYPGANPGERKPIRTLANFTMFDPKHRNEMIALDILETEEKHDREMVVVGYAKAHYEEQDPEDEGQEDEDDEEEPILLELSAIMMYAFDYTEWNDPIYIQTEWAWYILDMPSSEYVACYQHFFSPKRIAQMVLSTAKKHSRRTLEIFLEKFTERVDPFGHTYVPQDLWDSVPEIYETLQYHKDGALLRNTPLIREILGSYYPFAPKKRRRDPNLSAPVMNQVPANRLIGSVDLASRKKEHQNPTHITPRIAALAVGLVPETLRVVGKPLPRPNKSELDRNRLRRQKRICELIARARKAKKNIRWEKADRITAGSQYLKRVYIEGETYNVGDVVLVPNEFNSFWRAPDRYGKEPLDVPLQATIADFFWFGKVQWLSHDTGEAHLQWFEHGSGIFLQELCDEQQLYLANLCTRAKFNAIVGKVDVHWNVPPGKSIDFHHFACNFMYDGSTGSFYDINPDDLTISDVVRAGENCPSCILTEGKDFENDVRKTKDSKGIENGFTFRGTKYHYGDFVYYYSEDGPANIGFITQFNVGTQAASDFVTCNVVGRISELEDILPTNILRDERHLYLTEEVVKVKIKDLLGVIFVPCESSLNDKVTLQEWVDMSPDHLYIKYSFKVRRPTSWGQRRRINWDDLEVCAPCWEEKISEVKARKTTIKEFQKRPLKTIDLFAGAGAFSNSLAQGSEALVVTHAIELEASASKTFQRNFPNTTVYNQCANTMLQYTIKTWEGIPVKRPYQLYDEKVLVPAPPAKGEIKVIVAGFPCQRFSTLAKVKDENNITYNLFLNALSWVDIIRPWFVFFENVPGFVVHPLGATQAGKHRLEGGIEMGALKLLVRGMLDMGYQVRFSLLQAAHYGAPQGRRRFFLVAALKGRPLPDFPQPSHHFDGSGLEIKLPYGVRMKEPMTPIRIAKGTAIYPTVTIDHAIGDLPRFDWKHPQRNLPARYEANKQIPALTVPYKTQLTSGALRCGYSGVQPYHHEPKTRFQLEVRAKGTRNIQHFTRATNPGQVRRVIAIPLRAKADYRSLAPKNQEWQMSNALSSKGRKNYQGGAYGRLDKDGTFRTITTNISPTAKQGWVLNPYCHRLLTVRELARAQGFPDNFVFESIGNSVITIQRQIGNAVPYPLGRALGRQLRIALLQKWSSAKQNTIQIEDDVEMQDADDYDNRSDTMATPSP